MEGNTTVLLEDEENAQSTGDENTFRASLVPDSDEFTTIKLQLRLPTDGAVCADSQEKIWKFGRSDDCSDETRFNDKRISTHHATLTLRLSQTGSSQQQLGSNRVEVLITDQSTNGTYVNMEKLGKSVSRTLKDGDKISLGVHSSLPRYILHIHCDPTSSPSPRRNRGKRSISDNEDDSNSFEKISFKRYHPSVDDSAPIAEELNCGICHDLMHQPVTLAPCMHKFCGGCFCEWRRVSPSCPHCRSDIAVVSRDQMVQNLIDLFVKSHPERRRQPEDIADLEAQNTIQVGQPLRLNMGGANIANANDDEDEGENEEDDEGSEFIGSSSEADDDSVQVTCPSCPPASGPGNYQCASVGPPHVRCTTCQTLLPDRHDTATLLALVPPRPVRCTLCSRPSCGRYIPGSNCSLFFLTVSEFSQSQTMIPHSRALNDYERTATMSALQSRNETLADVWSDLISRLENHEVVIQRTNTPQPGGVSNDIRIVPASASGFANITTVTDPDQHICRVCWEPVACEAAFIYRRDKIQDDDLPDSAKGRDDCWWGRNCWTQMRNPAHAARLNHVCEQTRQS
ncbi:hypothetical protein BJ742DRAFT_805802 [Cladochytrium replicatum]|nr:hypothetical protein BJ742DRAFT_805802 [Cladochytrium replicatum]